MSVGSLRKLSIRGTDFTLIADTDLDEKPPTKNELIATTGLPLAKSTVQIPETTGFKIAYSKANNTLLKTWASDGQDSEFDYTDQNGDVSYCTGRFDITSTSTMNGEINITVLPVTQWV